MKDYIDRLRRIEELSRELERFDNEHLFRAAFSWVPIGIAMIKEDGTIMRVNNALCRLLRHPVNIESKENIKNIGWFSLTHPDDMEIDCTIIREIVDGNIEVGEITKRLRTFDNEWIYVDITMRAPYKTEHPEFVAFIVPSAKM